MDRNEIEKKVNDVLERKLGGNTEKIEPTADLLVDLGLDSLDCVEIIMELEKEFGISISDEKTDKCYTVGDIYTIVEELV